MGISDRDYARPDREHRRGAWFGGRGGGGALRGLTVIHWLVIINVAVFVFDAIVGVGMGHTVLTHMGTYMSPHASTDTVVDRSTIGVNRQSGLRFFPVRERATGEVVGEWRFTHMAPIQSIGHFSTAKGFVGLEVWRFVTFQFLHGDIYHLLFNMIALWFFGPLVENYLRSKRLFLGYYLICGICGALLYLILNLAGYLAGSPRPLLLINDVYTPLIGASAGVFGVLMASAFIAGNAIMLVFFVLPMRVSTGAYLMFFFALANLFFGGQNAGGDAAHVGGAVAGFFFIRRSHLLKDFLSFSPPARKAGRPRRGWLPGRASDPAADERRVDELLKKVSEHGLHSLTDKEREFLRRQSEKQRGAS